ncbi:MAG: hypothetical protein HEQ25_21555 [Dolichospermum sp. DET73]|uniref:hypothetical protein n=2 Tax=Nostocales TaxID=1161 RepID=UPI001391CB38|nr:hypothetical protein [Anabaena sp. 90]MBO1054480.1 hypothetical protein [Dolichospermum sp. DET73]
MMKITEYHFSNILLVLAHGDTREAHKFDLLINTLNHASLFNEYTQITTLLQKEQDNLEKVFQ